MKHFFCSHILASVLFFSAVSVVSCTTISTRDVYRDLPFEMQPVERPAIPSREADITDFGGKGDGVSLNSEAFAATVAHLSEAGGGRLVVPCGVWLTGPIELRSNIELHLEPNSIIVFSQNRDLYPVVETVFEGRDTYRCQPLLSAVGQHDIAITGNGIIDGAGDSWRAIKRDKISPSEWKRLTRGGVLSADGKTWYPTENFRKGAADADQNIAVWAVTREDFESIKDFLRPVMVNFRECRDVLLEGVVFQNSPSWNIHFAMTDNILIDRIAVRCPWYAQNGDGVDIESCTNVVMTDSWIDAGDDAICIKSGKDEDGRRRGIPSSNIIVDGCICYHGHGGFVVGSEMSGGVKNIAVRNCTFSGTDVGLRFKSTRGRGGVVEDIYIDNIVMNDIATEALLFDLFYGGKSAVEELEEGGGDEPSTDMKPLPVDETTPQFRNIRISNVTCRGARRAMLFNGLPEMNVENVEVTDTFIESEIGAEVNESTGVRFERVTIVPREGAALKINNVKNFEVVDFRCPEELSTALTVTGSRNDCISVESPQISAANASISKSAVGAVAIE